MEKRFGMLSSSVNPNEVANTVRGLVLSLSSVIIMVAGLMNIPLADSQIAEAASAIGLAAGALWTLYGLTLRVVVYFSDTTRKNEERSL